MSLEKHTKIIFQNLKFENKINFLEIWEETFKKIYLNKKANFNDPLMTLRINKNFYLCKYFIYTKNLKGDFLECGVFKGFSSLLLKSLEEKLSNFNIINYFLVDSFEGLSDILEEDKPAYENIYQNKKGDLKASLDSVEDIFKVFKNVNIIKGWIPEVFSSLDEKNKYKFVHIDVDLYQPTFDTLNYVYDKVVKGGIIITDDYRSPSFPGNQKAWEKFFKSIKSNSWLSLPSGQAVIIKE